MASNGNKPTFRATNIRISNLAGVEELEFQPGSVTVIKGRNAGGKTSVLKALQSLAGAEEAKLLRTGSTKGEVVVLFEADDGRQLNAKRVYRDSGTPETSLTDQNGEDAGGATIMKALWNAYNANPMRFIQAEKKERLAILLETLPIELDESRLEEILQTEGGPLEEVTYGSTAFDTIELTRKAVFDRRTDINRNVRKDKDTVSSLEKDLPPEQGDCESQLNEARATKERLEKVRREVIAELAAKRDKAIQQAHDEYTRGVRQTDEEAGPKIEKAAGQVATWEERQKTSIAAGERRRIIQVTRGDLSRNEKLAEQLSTALDEIDKLKLDLLNSLPIPGLEVRGKEIFYNGVDFDDLSTAEQLSIGIRIAKLRAGDIGLVCVDRIESLDPSNFEGFVKQAKDSGLQWIVSSVAAGELEIVQP